MLCTAQHHLTAATDPAGVECSQSVTAATGACRLTRPGEGTSGSRHQPRVPLSQAPPPPLTRGTATTQAARGPSHLVAPPPRPPPLEEAAGPGPQRTSATFPREWLMHTHTGSEATHPPSALGGR